MIWDAKLIYIIAIIVLLMVGIASERGLMIMVRIETAKPKNRNCPRRAYMRYSRTPNLHFRNEVLEGTGRTL